MIQFEKYFKSLENIIWLSENWEIIGPENVDVLKKFHNGSIIGALCQTWYQNFLKILDSSLKSTPIFYFL